MIGGNVTKKNLDEKIEIAKSRIKELELLIKYWEKQT
tara:strand:- start:418 stop:528 length:111 start_codon:yes stop_codon:yes gene_type:complete